jgi:hypothetical protein
MPTRRLAQWLSAALAAEFILGFGGALTPRGEIFPFASWLLFSLVPYHTSEYDLRLEVPDGKPVSFSEAGSLVRNPHSIVTFQLIQQLGRAVAARRNSETRRLRAQLEAFFQAPKVHYDLVTLTYDPVQRWNTGQILAIRQVAAFISGEPAPAAQP